MRIIRHNDRQLRGGAPVHRTLTKKNLFKIVSQILISFLDVYFLGREWWQFLTSNNIIFFTSYSKQNTLMSHLNNYCRSEEKIINGPSWQTTQNEPWTLTNMKLFKIIPHSRNTPNFNIFYLMGRFEEKNKWPFLTNNPKCHYGFNVINRRDFENDSIKKLKAKRFFRIHLKKRHLKSEQRFGATLRHYQVEKWKSTRCKTNI